MYRLIYLSSYTLERHVGTLLIIKDGIRLEHDVQRRVCLLCRSGKGYPLLGFGVGLRHGLGRIRQSRLTRVIPGLQEEIPYFRETGDGLCRIICDYLTPVSFNLFLKISLFPSSLRCVVLEQLWLPLNYIHTRTHTHTHVYTYRYTHYT